MPFHPIQSHGTSVAFGGWPACTWDGASWKRSDRKQGIAVAEHQDHASPTPPSSYTNNRQCGTHTVKERKREREREREKEIQTGLELGQRAKLTWCATHHWAMCLEQSKQVDGCWQPGGGRCSPNQRRKHSVDYRLVEIVSPISVQGGWDHQLDCRCGRQKRKRADKGGIVWQKVGRMLPPVVHPSIVSAKHDNDKVRVRRQCLCVSDLVPIRFVAFLEQCRPTDSKVGDVVSSAEQCLQLSWVA